MQLLVIIVCEIYVVLATPTNLLTCRQTFEVSWQVSCFFSLVKTYHQVANANLFAASLFDVNALLHCI